ncbi:MAG: hypothetical protein JST43_06765 [Bacteroidetes bacterium]|nr:hypothetical protein [Bacteroidota bacterium]MBS1539607.1 hypothetical protein [Bacteroidota bacterium]
MNQSLHKISRMAVLICALSLLTAYFVPLWQILMWAPQYPEGLAMKIWINDLSGDVKIISALNHYIGMRAIDTSMFPEFKYLIYLVAIIIGVGVLAFLINRRWSLLAFLAILVMAGFGALLDFYLWGYDYGHNLNPEAPIRVPGMSYQPPLLGSKQLLNFLAFSGPDIGGWIFIIASWIIFFVAVFEIFFKKKLV